MVSPDWQSFSILDCILRDGGSYIHWDFEDQLGKEYLDNMNELPEVNFIKIFVGSRERRMVRR